MIGTEVVVEADAQPDPDSTAPLRSPFVQHALDVPGIEGTDCGRQLAKKQSGICCSHIAQNRKALGLHGRPVVSSSAMPGKCRTRQGLGREF